MSGGPFQAPSMPAMARSERPAAVAEGTFLSTSSSESIEACTVIVVGLWDSPRLLGQVQKLIRCLQQRCGPVRAAHRFPVKPPPRLLRPLYPGVVLAVTFTEPAAAEAAVALSSAPHCGGSAAGGWSAALQPPGGTRGAERDGSAAAHGFRISPIRAFRLGAEDAEDCRKTFMPKELMLRLRATKTADPRRGTEPRGYLPLSHTPQLTQNKKDKDPPQRADPGADLVPRHDLTVEEELRRANARWRISERLWFVMCSNLSWYARKMDWRAAESAAARGDAVVIDETSCFEVFDAMIPPPKTEQGEPCGTAGATDSTTTVPRPQAVGASGTALGGSQGLGVGPTLLSSVRERVGGRGSARDAESFDALAALQKTYGLKPPNAEKEHRRAAAATTASPKFRNWSPGRFLPGWSRRMGQQALVDGSSEDEGLPQPSGLLPWVWRWLAPGSSWSTLSACRRKPYGDDAEDQPDKQRRRLEAPPLLLPFAVPPPPPGSATDISAVAGPEPPVFSPSPTQDPTNSPISAPIPKSPPTDDVRSRFEAYAEASETFFGRRPSAAPAASKALNGPTAPVPAWSSVEPPRSSADLAGWGAAAPWSRTTPGQTRTARPSAGCAWGLTCPPDVPLSMIREVPPPFKGGNRGSTTTHHR